MMILSVSGNITADATVKVIGDNTLTSFTIASNEKYKAANGENVTEVTYIRCSIWNNTKAKDMLLKGRGITAMGSFKPRKAVNQNGDLETYFNLRVSFFQVFGKNETKSTQPETFTAVTPPLTPAELSEKETDLPF
jgi:single-stranded DNA-binding protein